MFQMSSEMLNKLRTQRKFGNLKAFQKMLENSTFLEEYLSGKSQSLSDNIEILPSNGYIHVDNDLHYLFETDPTLNGTRVTEIRSGDFKLMTTIEDNFYYQHMFNFALVVILLLQVIVVWAFIWCRLTKYDNQQMNQSTFHGNEEGVQLREMGELPELIPQYHRQQEGGRDDVGNGTGEILRENRSPRHG